MRLNNPFLPFHQTSRNLDENGSWQGRWLSELLKTGHATTTHSGGFGGLQIQH